MPNDINVIAGWLIWTPDADTRSPILDAIDDLEPALAKEAVTKLARMTQSIRQVGYQTTLAQQKSFGGSVPIFYFKLARQVQLHISAKVIDEIPTILGITQLDGTTPDTHKFQALVRQRLHDLSAVEELAAAHPELKIAKQRSAAKTNSSNAVVRPTSKNKGEPIELSPQVLDLARQVQINYNNLAALLDVLTVGRAKKMKTFSDRSLDISVLEPLAELNETEVSFKLIRIAEQDLRDTAYQLGVLLIDRNNADGVRIPVVNKALGTVTTSQLKEPWAKTAATSAGILLAIHVAQGLPIDADAEPLGPFPLSATGAAREFWLANAAALLETQRIKPRLKYGAGFNPEVIKQLTEIEQTTTFGLSADMMVVKALGNFESPGSIELDFVI